MKLSGFIIQNDYQIKPAETNFKTEEREKKVNTEEEEEFERTRKNKYKRENDDQRFYRLVLAECDDDVVFFV